MKSRFVAGWWVAGLCVTLATAASAQPDSDDNAITAYSGGRFMLRQARSDECVVALQGTVTRDATSRCDDVVGKADRIRCNKLLGGVERVLWGSRAAIGLHQAKDYDYDRFGTSLGTHRIKDYLRAVVSATADRIFGIILGTSCQSITWIHGDRAIDLGVATKLEAPGVDVFGPEASRRVKQ